MSRDPELIITEGDSAAKRVADILSGETASAERMNGMDVYRQGDKRYIGLSGHVVDTDFPSEYDGWRDVEPVGLIGAPVEKHPTQENIVAALRRLTRHAGKVTIATDYDREGEFIGKEAYELVRDVNGGVPVDRVRFSSITNCEVTEAFENLDDLDFDLATAGGARQIIDLVWGAALTRFLSLSAHQLGNDSVSVGRIQGPTLRLIVDHEHEVDTSDPKDYWGLFSKPTKDADSDAESFEAQYFYLNDDGTEAERIRDEGDAEEAYQILLDVGAVEVSSINRRTRTDMPPAPFNTTQFIRATGSIGYSAQRAMSITKGLYTADYITCPRTDNTVYPDDLGPRELLGAFGGDHRFEGGAEFLLEQEEIEPTEDDNETTDHPPICLTGELPSASSLPGDE